MGVEHKNWHLKKVDYFKIVKHLTRPLVPVNAKETELHRQLPVGSDLKIYITKDLR